MSVRENFADIYLRGMSDRRMRSGTELAREIQLTDRSTAGNMSNRSSGVQIPRDICTRSGHYLYSTKCSWIIRNGNRTEWSPIRSVIIRVITKSDDHADRIVYQAYDFRPNWTTRSPITN